LHEKAGPTDVQQGHLNVRARNFALDPSTHGEAWMSTSVGLCSHYCLNRPFGCAHLVGRRPTAKIWASCKRRNPTPMSDFDYRLKELIDRAILPARVL
jgi:hypothetical protein